MLCIGRDSATRVNDAQQQKENRRHPNPIQEWYRVLLSSSPSYFIDLSLLGNASQHPTPSLKHMQPAHDAFRIIISVVNIIRQTA